MNMIHKSSSDTIRFLISLHCIGYPKCVHAGKGTQYIIMHTKIGSEDLFLMQSIKKL